LHHLIAELDFVMAQLCRYAKPGGTLLFAEPVNFSPILRRLRFTIPVHTDATPDERPLEPAEIEIVCHHIPGLRIRRFSFLGRLDRLLLKDYNFERSHPLRRCISDLMARADAVCLRLPLLENFCGTAVLHGKAPVSLDSSRRCSDATGEWSSSPDRRSRQCPLRDRFRPPEGASASRPS